MMSKLLRGAGLASVAGSVILFWRMWSNYSLDAFVYLTYDVIVVLFFAYFFTPLLFLTGVILLVLARVTDADDSGDARKS